MTFDTLEQIELRGQRVFIRCDLNVPLDPSGRISDDTRNRASLAGAIAGSGAFTLAGGGDTVAAIHQFEVDECIDCVSTAAGAFLEFLEGKTLPAVQVLKDRRH